MRKVYYLFLILFLIAWFYRFQQINTIIGNSQLLDFKWYYNAAESLISIHPNFELISKVAMGTPFVLIPFLPFSLLPFKLSEYIITIVNLICYFMAFYLIWRNYFLKITWFFWFFMALMAFAFPISYSLGMGNPIGFVTFSIYFFLTSKRKILKFLFLVISVLLKIFPVVFFINYLFDSQKIKTLFKLKQILTSAFSIIFLILTFKILIPIKMWSSYFSSITNLFKESKTLPSFDIYNQSFSSTFAKFGLNFHFFSFAYWLFFAFLLIFFIIFITYWKKLKKGYKKNIDFAIILMCLVILLHPFPWQYYFAVFLPYLMIQLGEFKWKYVFAFILICLNGDKFNLSGIFKGFIDSSQFFGTLILYINLIKDYRSLQLKIRHLIFF